MVTRAERLAAEIAHGRMLRERYPAIWSWATPAGERRAGRRAARLAAAGGFPAGSALLDLGCGAGAFTLRVAAACGARAVGVDVSRELVAEARRRNPGAEFHVGDAHALPFADRAFHGVFGSSVLHHLELGPALAEILRVLAPGGRIAFAEPNRLNPQVFLQKSVPALKRRALDLPHETAFARWALARALRHAGFTEVRVEPFDFLHPLTPAGAVGAVEALGRALERLPLAREVAGSLLATGRRAA